MTVLFPLSYMSFIFLPRRYHYVGSNFQCQLNRICEKELLSLFPSLRGKSIQSFTIKYNNNCSVFLVWKVFDSFLNQIEEILSFIMKGFGILSNNVSESVDSMM